MIIKFAPTHNFSAIPNELMHDPSLSLMAKAIACYLCSLPTTWQVNIFCMAKALKLNRDTIYKYLTELKAKGWLIIKSYRTQKGLFSAQKDYILQIPNTPKTPDGGENQAPNTPKPPQAPILGGCDAQNPAECARVTASEQTAQLKRSIKRNMGEARARDSFFKKDSQERVLLTDSVQTFRELLSLCQINLKGLDPEEQKAYCQFLAHRQARTKVSHAMKIAIRDRLIELKNKGADVCACVDLSVRRGYNDILEPKNTDTRFLSRVKALFAELYETYNGLNENNILEVIPKALDRCSKPAKEQA
ncbi:helix-turn-helix domain-containing protein [Helicobacter sp. L8]|uniref:helix-turn-helix domain-containing protein n=1 Tax=Helicobacter sp. L8 TaxID=2316078 RepID=UPI000EB04371|nr:helix-turn-helix domain-containing protein [Helicobacter sp. L8]